MRFLAGSRCELGTVFICSSGLTEESFFTAVLQKLQKRGQMERAECGGGVGLPSVFSFVCSLFCCLETTVVASQRCIFGESTGSGLEIRK